MVPEMRSAAAVLLLGFLLCLWPQLVPGQPADAPAVGTDPSPGQRLVAAARRHLGKPYVFGGRDGRSGCVAGRHRNVCPQGIDCLSLLFFAYEEVTGRPWQSFSVLPSRMVRRGELGQPVTGLAGVLAREVDRTKLQPGDVLLFLLEDYNLEADAPLVIIGGRRYGVWHTGLVNSCSKDELLVLHAKPGDRVVIERLDQILFDGLYAIRWDGRAARRIRERKREVR